MCTHTHTHTPTHTHVGARLEEWHVPPIQRRGYRVQGRVWTGRYPEVRGQKCQNCQGELGGQGHLSLSLIRVCVYVSIYIHIDIYTCI